MCIPKQLKALLIVAVISGGSSGCTMLGMVADSHISSDRRQTVVDQKTGLAQTVEPPALLTELGMAVDGAVINGIKQLTQNDKPKPKEICKHNGYYTECRPAGKQRGELVD